MGACTANVAAAAVQYERFRAGQYPAFLPSRLFIYYTTRVLENEPLADNGAMIRNCFKALKLLGVCPETSWPYDKLIMFKPPTPDAYAEALAYRALKYMRVPRDYCTMRKLLVGGTPFTVGIVLPESTQDGEQELTGEIQFPAGPPPPFFKHALLVVGYDHPNRVFICRNSWGTDYGMAGYCTVPYAYFEEPFWTKEFWCLKLMSA
jgi:C1A family cysteine protease